jgi:hypothetical protein
MSFYDVGPVSFESVSAVTATPGSKDGEIGYRKFEGGKEYVRVYNDCNSTIPPGYGVVLQSGVSGYSITLSSVTSADLMVGVSANTSMPTGNYGWVVTKGITPIQMGVSGVAAGTLAELGANGLFTTVSNTTGNIAPATVKALAAIASSVSGSAYVSCF